MSRVLVLAPHADDETLGCGGTLLWHRSRGDELHWLLATEMKEDRGFSRQRIAEREKEIREVARGYSFKTVHRLGWPAAAVEDVPKAERIRRIGEMIKKIKPEILYLPHAGDAHGDHEALAEAALACLKWFRYGSVRRALAYETLSETNFQTNRKKKAFMPNVYRDITSFLDKKITIMKIYKGELKAFPFPRSVRTIRALATLRGSESGCRAAESFMLLKEIGRSGK